MEAIVDPAAGVTTEVPSLGDEPAWVSVPTLLRNVSDEIARCADMAFDLQDAFASARQAGQFRPDIARMQSLDLLEQTLRDLANVTVLLARREPIGSDMELAEHCKLDDVARRLQGRAAAAHSTEPDFF